MQEVMSQEVGGRAAGGMKVLVPMPAACSAGEEDEGRGVGLVR